MTAPTRTRVEPTADDIAWAQEMILTDAGDATGVLTGIQGRHAVRAFAAAAHGALARNMADCIARADLDGLARELRRALAVDAVRDRVAGGAAIRGQARESVAA